MARARGEDGTTPAEGARKCELCSEASGSLGDVLEGVHLHPERGVRIHDLAVHWFVKPDERALSQHLRQTFGTVDVLRIVDWWRVQDARRRAPRHRGPDSWEWKMAELERHGLCDPVNVQQLAVEHFGAEVPEYVVMVLRMWRKAIEKEAKRERSVA